MATIPMPTAVPRVAMVRAALACGVVSSLLFVGMNAFVPLLWDDYDSASQTVSELSAVDAPTRPLWVALAVVYNLLVIAFGWGVWASADHQRRLHVVGALLVVYALVGLAWPPMHQREVIAAGGATLSDTLHIAFTIAAVALMVTAMGFGAAALGARFRWYSIATIVTLLGFGILTSLDAPGVDANLPTPWIGVWERINIGVFLLWVVVLAIARRRSMDR